MRTRCIPLALAALSALSVPAQAQTFEEAVQSNTRLGVALCLQVMIDRTLPRNAFGAAGFTYRADARGVNSYGIDQGFGHYFDAPADTAKAEVNNPDRTAGICTVYTKHLPEPVLASLVGNEIFQRYPSAQTRSATQWSIPTASGLPLIVNTGTIGTRHRYEDPGTVTVSMSYPG